MKVQERERTRYIYPWMGWDKLMEVMDFMVAMRIETNSVICRLIVLTSQQFLATDHRRTLANPTQI